MPRDFDADVRSGEQIGPDRYIWREYSVPVIGEKPQYLTYYDKDGEIPEGAVLIGIHEHHKSTKSGLWCGGYLRFENVPEAVEAGNANHTLVSANPLTIQPSLGCRGCSSHGYIREGKWTDA